MTAAVVHDYDDLILVLKHQADACGLSQIVLEDLAKLPSGYVGKLFGPGRMRRVGFDSLWSLLEALALRMVIEPDLAAAQRMEGKWERRDDRYRRAGVVRRQYSTEARAKILSEAGRVNGVLGGHARALCLGGKHRSRIAKKAANARWKRARTTPAPVPMGGAPIGG